MIAAAVIGGTSFAGGIGTIPGAILGARGDAVAPFGMVLMGFDSPIQDIVVGDRARRRRSGSTPTTGGAAADDRRAGVHAATASPDATAPLVEMRDIRVAFGGVHAVDDVTIDLHAGEVVGLVGGNGAGKSTLMRVLSGAHRPTRARSSSTASRSRSPTRATPRRYGIETIYQTLALADNVDAPANMFLGRELTHALGVARRRGDGDRPPAR